MAEKKGFTGKLKYNFPVQKCLEVKLSNGKWYRVTANDFRSFDTERRIGYGDDLEPYNDIIYYFGTNTKAPQENTGKIIFHPQYPKRETLLRPNERHLLDKV
jgi:hypothetical protein